MASYFDATPATNTITSNRGFMTITGYYQGVHVSIVSIGMGPSMMDFFVRETRSVTKGPLAIVRFGTCGGIGTEGPGSIVVASGGSGFAIRNPDAFGFNGETVPNEIAYRMSKIAPADKSLSTSITKELINVLGADVVSEGVNVTAESFYSSQGRIDPNFDDCNLTIIDDVVRTYPNAKTMEMESFQLLHLANCSKIPIYASACAIVVANRRSAKVIDGPLLRSLELNGGKAILDAIIKRSLSD